ncbi:MAG: hypothetical protein LBI03_10180, partial [Clostridiales bacterium]|nr:hypothetical protein [Clostridiales bacterium]
MINDSCSQIDCTPPEYSLEKHLKILSDCNNEAFMLYSIWERDKHRISSRISHTATPFLTYSDHGPDHSAAIVANIARLLCERVKCLGAPDTWMILECAYRHDVGMTLGYDEMKERVTSEKFLTYLEELKFSSDVDLQRAATYILENKKTLLNHQLSDENWLSWTLRTERNIMLVLANQLRKEHGINSKHILDSEEEQKLHPEIPERIWKIMGLICQGHNEDSKWMLTNLE